MSRVGLKQVIGRSAEARALVDALSAALGSGMAIEDAEGRLLHGERSESHNQRHAVSHGEAALGWVSGTEGARAVATLLDHLVTKEIERKALGAEVLHLYREINLIYSFSEKLAALLEVERVASLTLQQARQMIVATDGVIMLLDEDSGVLTSVAAFGDEMPVLQGFRRGHGIIGTIAQTGVGEIVNDVDLDPRRVTEHTTVKALICRAAAGGGARDGRDRDWQHAADGLHRCRVEAAEHAGAADRDRDRERAAVRAHRAGGARARAAAGAAPGSGSGARQARERDEAGRAHPGRPVPAVDAGDRGLRSRGP